MTKKIVRRRKERGRKKYLRALLVMLCFCLLITVCPAMPGATVVHAAGDGTDANPWLCGAEADGSNVKATLINGTLTISGNGKMQDYTGSRPWNDSTASITRVVIKEGVTSIGNNVFNGCSALESITIPTSVTSIGLQAFLNCSSLTEIKIPAGVTNFGTNPFGGCSNLTKIEVDGENKNYKSQNDAILTIKGDTLVVGCKSTTIPEGVTSIRSYAFSGCSGLTSVTIPDSVTSIGNYAFKGCSGLTSIEIPAGVNSIGYNAFFNCIKLMKVTMHRENRENLPTLGTNAFYGCPCVSGNTKGIYVPVGTGDAYKEEEGWSTYGAHIAEIVASGTCGTHVTWTLTDDGTLTISGEGEMDDHNSSGGVPFDRYRSMIKTVVIENGVKSIGGYAFWQCSDLTSVTIPESVESIGGLAFYSCSKLTSITIPGSVRSIESYAFESCSGLTSITFEGTTTIPTVKSNTFNGCPAVAEGAQGIHIPECDTSCEYLKKYLDMSGWTDYKSNIHVVHGGLSYATNNADTAVIQQYCTCGSTEYGTATLSVPADANLIYNGSAITPVKVIYSAGWQEQNNNKPTESNIKYTSNVNVGTNTATASLTISGAKASLKFSITAKPLESSMITVAGGPHIYTGSEVKPTVTVTDSVGGADRTLTKDTDYTVTYENNTAAGENTAKVIIKGTGNYSGNITKTFTITPAAMTGVSATGHKGTYDGTAHGITVTAPKGAKVRYGTEAGIYDLTASPTYTDVGTHTVYYQVKKDNYTTVTGSVEVKIEAFNIKDATVELDSTALTYSGSAQTKSVSKVTVEVNGEPVTLNGETDYKVSGNTQTNAGIHTITITGTGNYSGSCTTDFTIASAAMTGVSASGYTGTYDGEPHSIDVKVTSPADAAITYSTDGKNYSSTNPSFTNAVNSTTVFYKIEKENYQPVTGSATVKIDRRSISSATVTLDNTDLTYNGSEQTKDVSKVTVSVDGKILTLIKGTDYKVSGNTQTNAGTHTIMIEGKGNYSGSITKTFTITPAAMTGVSATGHKGTYDGESHGITVTASDGATVKYRNEEGTYDLTASPTYTDAGTYTVYFQVTKDNYKTWSSSVNVIIEARDIRDATVTLDDNDLTYNGSEQTKNVSSVIVEVNSKTRTLTEGTDYEVSGNTQTNAGTHTITIKGKGNYSGSTMKTFTIASAAMTGVSADGYEGTYDGIAHGITVTAPDGATVTYRTDGEKNYGSGNPSYTNAGTYTVHYKITKDNYETIEGYKTVKINKKSLTITTSNQSIMWGKSIDQTKYSVPEDGIIKDDQISKITLTPSTEALTDNGTISISDVKIENASKENVTDNYNIIPVEGTLEVTHNTTLAPNSIDVVKTNTSYTAGDTLNVDDITVTASYADKYSEEVRDFKTNVADIDMSEAGEKILTVSYTENGGTATANITITVNEKQVTDGDWNGVVTSGSVKIVGYSGSDTAVEVPSIIDGMPVTVIGKDAFAGHTDITSVTIPDSVTAIGESAFSGCTGLTTITIPDSVTAIGENAFVGCTGLTTVIIPNGVDTTSAGITDTAAKITYKDENGTITITSVTPGKDGDIEKPVTLPDTIGGKKPEISQDVKEEMKNISHEDKGGTATCTKKAVCEICGEEYGEPAGHEYEVTWKWTEAAAADDYTATAIITCTHADSDWQCDFTDKKFTGDAAGDVKVTPEETETATCEKDGERTYTASLIYNEVTYTGEEKQTIPAKGHTLHKKEAKKPTSTEAGNKEYWTCTACNKLFADEQGKTETNSTEVTIPPTGDGEAWSSVITSDGLKIVGYSGSDTTVEVPSKIGDMPVTAIGDNAFAGNTEITSVTIPGSVTTIGKDAFAGCTGLTTITIPENLDTKDAGITDTVAKITYTVDEEGGKINITSVTSGSGTAVEIPYEIDGMPVTAIGDNAFVGNTEITSVTIPDSVTTIGMGAFSGCTGLTTITIPENLDTKDAGITDTVAKITYTVDETGKITITSVTPGSNTAVEVPSEIDGMPVTAIGENAFAGCTGLTTITIPDSVTAIGKNAFSDCVGLTSVTIPDSVTAIGEGAFSGCTGLTDITIPDSVTAIGEGTFSSCTGLTTITIPDSVTAIGENAFSDCTGLTTVIIPNGVDTTSAGITDTVAKITYTVDEENGTITITSVTPGSDTAVEVPSEIDGRPVTAIGENAFAGNTEITSVTIPDSVTAISEGAFSGCTGLTDITIPDSVTEIGKDAFSGCTGLTDITIPDSVTTIGKVAFSGCTGLTSVTIPDSVTAIGEDAFSGCTGLTSVTIPDSVTAIGEDAFAGCTGLTTITIPDSVTAIGESAFSGCTGLTTVIIPNGVDTTSAGITDTAAKITYTVDEENGTITITSVTPGSGTAVEVPSKIDDMPVTAIGENAFAGNTEITSVTIPDSVTAIGEDAFSGCTGLTSVTIPDGVTAISEGAFSGCTGLTDITMPDSVTEIGKDAFSGCTGLTDITIPDSVTEIGKDAFSGCTGLTDITIPDSVTAIGKDAFADCTGLTTINIPNSVDTTSAGITDTATKITYKDENGKITITSVTPGGDTAIELPSEIDGRPVTAIGENAFAGNTEITSVTIPGSVTTIGKDAFSGCTGLTTIIIPENLDTTSAGIINTAAKITYKDENGKITITSVTPGTDGDGGEKPVILPDTIGGKKPEIPDAVKEEIKNISHEHKGGTATCTQKAVCEICGVEYGDFAGHTLVKIEGVEPTHAADGSMAYWTCSKCGKKFSDENGATEITDPTIPATGNESPKSGDDSNPAFWTLLMLISMTALVGLFVKKRKTERHDER